MNLYDFGYGIAATSYIIECIIVMGAEGIEGCSILLCSRLF